MKYHSELGLSPFVGGANIYFQDTNQNQGEVKRFIEDFGQHIKSLKFEENGPGITQKNAKFRFGKMVQKSLENCPNLQKLALKTKADRIERLECRLQGALDECFKQNSLGVPKNLISLSMNMHEDYNKKPNLSPILMTKLVKPFYEAQLRKFKVYWTPNLKLKMPHLKDLTLIIRHIVFFNSCDCSGILGAEWLQAPIQKMHLKLDNPCKTQSIDLHKMLEMFPTIQYLKLDYGIWGSVNFTNPVSVWSHNIHTLELTNFIGHGDVPYDFFYAFPKLRYFNMRISWWKKHKISKYVKICHYLVPEKLFLKNPVSIYQTRIWKKAPNLEVVVIQFHKHQCVRVSACYKWSTDLCSIENVVGTREGYRRFCELKSAVKLAANI